MSDSESEKFSETQKALDMQRFAAEAKVKGPKQNYAIQELIRLGSKCDILKEALDTCKEFAPTDI
jgi:hypothetical protein